MAGETPQTFDEWWNSDAAASIREDAEHGEVTPYDLAAYGWNARGEAPEPLGVIQRWMTGPEQANDDGIWAGDWLCSCECGGAPFPGWIANDGIQETCEACGAPRPPKGTA